MKKRPGKAGGFRRSEAGATALEYALLIGFLALTCVVAVASLGSSLKGPFQHALTGLS